MASNGFKPRPAPPRTADEIQAENTVLLRRLRDEAKRVGAQVFLDERLRLAVQRGLVVPPGYHVGFGGGFIPDNWQGQ